MFNKQKQREKMMQMVSAYTPTSKASLKQFCIIAAKGNVEEAGKLYDFYMKDMEELPTFDPVPPNWMDNTKNVIGGVVGFIKENQDGILQGVEMVRGLMGKGGKSAAVIGEALPPIN